MQLHSQTRTRFVSGLVTNLFCICRRFFCLATTAEARLAAILQCNPGWQTVTTETDTTATARGNKRKTCANVVQIRQWRLFGNRTRCLICATMPRNVLLSLQLFKPGTLFDWLYFILFIDFCKVIANDCGKQCVRRLPQRRSRG